MTSISPSVNALLSDLKSAPIQPERFSLERVNGFLQEAYSINSRISELLSYLRGIRPYYLSNAPPPRRNVARKTRESTYLSNQQRDSIDAEAKSTLRDLNAAVTSLSQAESVRQQSEVALAQKRRQKRGFGALGSWAAGGKETEKSQAEEEEESRQKGIHTCREGVIWYLQRHLETCTKVQGQMMEARITTEIEKSRNALNLAKGAIPVSDGNLHDAPSPFEISEGSQIPIEELDRKNGEEQELSEEQMQMFQHENRDMLKLYSDRLDQVRTAEKSLIEISELHSTLAANLEVQSAQIDQLVGDSLYTEDNVGGGNKQLKKASERESTAKMAFWATVIGCGFLIGWDLVI